MIYVEKNMSRNVKMAVIMKLKHFLIQEFREFCKRKIIFKIKKVQLYGSEPL